MKISPLIFCHNLTSMKRTVVNTSWKLRRLCLGQRRENSFVVRDSDDLQGATTICSHPSSGSTLNKTFILGQKVTSSGAALSDRYPSPSRCGVIDTRCLGRRGVRYIFGMIVTPRLGQRRVTSPSVWVDVDDRLGTRCQRQRLKNAHYPGQSHRFRQMRRAENDASLSGGLGVRIKTTNPYGP
jgi:hypothetical protein